jgi:hypothetical protein
VHITVVLAALKPNRIIRKCMDVNCSSFHLRVFLGLSNPQRQIKTSTISIPRDNYGERKAKFIDNTSDTSSTAVSRIFRLIKAVNLHGIK